MLLAEDNLINQKVAQMMLTSLGMVVELASNGQEAMEAILKSSKAASQFHCVLMDMAMPVMGGVDATLVCPLPDLRPVFAERKVVLPLHQHPSNRQHQQR